MSFAQKSTVAQIAEVADPQQRVHVLGTIVMAQQRPTWLQGALDDGTGSVEFRLFRQEEVNVGDCVRIIGKMREYEGARYLAADILKKADPKWVQLWQLEMAPQQAPKDKLLELIRTLDAGQGAPQDEVLEKAGPQAAELIDKLKEQGEVFETRPGRLKVME